MSRQLIVQVCAVIALIVSAFRAGMWGETPAGDGMVTMIIVVVLMLVILGATVIPT